METLAYNPFPVSSFIPNDSLHQHAFSAFNPLSTSPTLFEFSSTPPSSQDSSILSPVADISNTLNGITVSSPQESPQKSQSPPFSPRTLSKPPKARRNLSLSMDHIKNSSDSATPCSSFKKPSPRIISSEDACVVPTTSSSPPTTIPRLHSNSAPASVELRRDSDEENPCKSPKRAREEKDKEDAELIDEFALSGPLSFPRPIPTPTLPRSASACILGGRENKQRSRSMLMKSESFVRKDPSVNCILPTTYGQHPDLQYVTPKTVADLIDGKFNDSIDEYHIIDCRFPYEYEVNIKTAVNLTENEVKQMFIDSQRPGKKVAIIFHCEFSSQRAPRCMRFLRELDRKMNMAHYPKLTYPDVYVIEGGFKYFFETCESHCNGTYVEMRDEKHFAEMKAHLRRFNFKRVRSMSADNTNQPFPFFQPIKL